MAELPPSITEKAEQLKAGGLQAFILRLNRAQSPELNFLFNQPPKERSESLLTQARRYQTWFDSLGPTDQATLAAALLKLYPHLSFEKPTSPDDFNYEVARNLIFARNKDYSLIETLDRHGWVDASVLPSPHASDAVQADELAYLIKNQRPELWPILQRGGVIGDAPVSVKIVSGPNNYLYTLKYLTPEQFLKVLRSLKAIFPRLSGALSSSPDIPQAVHALTLLETLSTYSDWQSRLLTAIEEARREDATVADASGGSRRSLNGVLDDL